MCLCVYEIGCLDGICIFKIFVLEFYVEIDVFMGFLRKFHGDLLYPMSVPGPDLHQVPESFIQESDHVDFPCNSWPNAQHLH